MNIDSNGNPILDQFSEEGFVDTILKINNFEERNKSYKFHLSASYNEKLLGFDVEVMKGFKSAFDGDANLIHENVIKKGVIFRRSGEESDRLINVLSKLYGLECKPRKMKKEETYTGIALHQAEIDMTNEVVKIKIFGRDSGEDFESEYNESFFNLDLVGGYVYWNEKDQDYRASLINGLSQE